MAASVEDEQAFTLERERLWFQQYEEYLHKAAHGPLWLKDERVARFVVEDLHHWDGERYRLDAFCVMPNHVHVVLMPLPDTEAGKAAYLNHQSSEDRDRNPGYLVTDTEGQRQFIILTFHSLASILHSINGIRLMKQIGCCNAKAPSGRWKVMTVIAATMKNMRVRCVMY